MADTDPRPLWVVAHGSGELYGSDRVLLASMIALRSDPDFRLVVVLHERGPLLEELRASGIEVHVGPLTKIRRSMFSLVGVIGLPWQIVSTARVLDAIVNRRRVVLVYSNTLAVLGAAIWARWRGLPHMWHVHEIIQRPAIVRRFLPKLAAFLSSRVLANSLQTRLWLESETQKLRGRVLVAFNGLAPVPSVPPGSIAEFRAKVGARDGDVIATLVGRFNHMKGQTVLVRALSLLRRAGKAENLRVVLVGDVYAGHTDFRAQCEALIQSLNLQDRVTVMPFQVDVSPVWWGSDIAVVASTEPESFGMVAIEAMAARLPVVASAHGGLLDIIEDNVTGYLIPPNDPSALADSLAKLAENELLRRRLGEAGAVRQKQRFSLDVQVSATRDAAVAAMAAMAR